MWSIDCRGAIAEIGSAAKRMLPCPREMWWPRERASSSSGGTGKGLHLVSILRIQGFYYLIGDMDKTQDSGTIKDNIRLRTALLVTNSSMALSCLLFGGGRIWWVFGDGGRLLQPQVHFPESSCKSLICLTNEKFILILDGFLTRIKS